MTYSYGTFINALHSDGPIKVFIVMARKVVAYTAMS